jgi:hypothetical protein
MSLTEKKKKAKKLKIEFKDDVTEDELDTLISEEEEKIESERQQNEIKKEEEKQAALEAKKRQIVLKDTDGEEVEQKDYFYPRVKDEKTNDGKILAATTETAPVYFNKVCGLPVEREDLLEVFNNIFPKKKKFLFYKSQDKEVYLIIIPLKYAVTIGKYNESTPGGFQRHALSFVNEGSVNLESLKMKLTKVANHPSISKEPLA